MRKITLLTTAVLLSTACFGSASLTTEATTLNRANIIKSGNRIIISNKDLNMEGSCNIDSLLEQLLPCLPVQRPCPPTQIPDTELPEVEIPDMETPDIEIPDVEIPETEIPNIPTPEAPNTPETETPEDNTNLSYIEQVVKLVNIERAKEGLAPLSVDENVQAAAQVRAVECEQSFSHTRPNGSSFSTALKEQNVSYRRAGENIAWGQRSPEEVVTAWMNSSGHRANIMNANYTKIGVGYYQNAKGVNYWSQLFIG